jgi:hypothetical protein
LEVEGASGQQRDDYEQGYPESYGVHPRVDSVNQHDNRGDSAENETHQGKAIEDTHIKVFPHEIVIGLLFAFFIGCSVTLFFAVAISLTRQAGHSPNHTNPP